MLNDGFEQWPHVAFGDRFLQACVASEGGSIDDREIQLFISGAQLVE